MLELDIYLPDLKKAIEFNGSYWHKNTRQQWKDEMKKKQCIQKSIDLLIINEFDWKKNKESVIQGIQKFLV